MAHPQDLAVAAIHACAERGSLRDYVDAAACIRAWPGWSRAAVDVLAGNGRQRRTWLLARLSDPPPKLFFRMKPQDLKDLRRFAQGLHPFGGDRKSKPTKLTGKPLDLGYDPRSTLRSWHGTSIPGVDMPLKASPRRLAIAGYIWWNGPPWTVLRNSSAYLWHVMDYATEEDLAFTEQDVSRELWLNPDIS